MKASYRWLRELSGVDATPMQYAEVLTRGGLEVEEITAFGEGLEHVIVAEVRGYERVPEKDKLRLVTVFTGTEETQVICGAPNVPEAGGRVLLAQPGAVLPGGFKIKARKVGGILSAGMLCSETELQIGADESGIVVLGKDISAAPGTSAVEALALADHVFEIGLTPNRPDCLGHIGLAREIAVGFEKPFAQPDPGFPCRVVDAAVSFDEPSIALSDDVNASVTHVVPADGIPLHVPIRIEDATRCPRYAGGVVQNVTVRQSPFWLRYRLHVLGVRAIDNVVDITNLVLFELGHPIHAFDLERLRGREIVVRCADAGEKMHSLDGEERTFIQDDLLICDGEGPVAIAGVMGGANSEIESSTTHVLVECAYFQPTSVRRTSRRVGLHTDSSHRFERGVDPNGVVYAMRRATSLIVALAGGAAVSLAKDVYPATIQKAEIALRPAQVSTLLGADVEDAQSRTILESLGCEVDATQLPWKVLAPSWRPDLTRHQDLSEEVARIWGYDKIPTKLPRVLPSGRGLSKPMRASRRLREAAAAHGLLETLNYAFVSAADLSRARVSTAGVRIANPLSDERSVMRTSLLPGLLANVRRAGRHQVRAVELFELARVYVPTDGPLPEEPHVLAIALAGPRATWIGEEAPFDFYDGKGRLSGIVEAAFGVTLEAKASDTLDASAPFLHPRRRALLCVGGQDVGVLGEIHPDVADDAELDVRMIYGEIALDALLAAVTAIGVPQTTGLPKFPSVQRDVALLVAHDVPAADVERAFRHAGGKLLEDVEIFDLYQGEHIPEGKKSLAFRVVYRDPQATLTDKKVEKAHGKLLKAVCQKLEAKVRS